MYESLEKRNFVRSNSQLTRTRTTNSFTSQSTHWRKSLREYQSLLSMLCQSTFLFLCLARSLARSGPQSRKQPRCSLANSLPQQWRPSLEPGSKFPGRHRNIHSIHHRSMDQEPGRRGRSSRDQDKDHPRPLTQITVESDCRVTGTGSLVRPPPTRQQATSGSRTHTAAHSRPCSSPKGAESPKEL